MALVSAALAFHSILAVVPVLGLGFWYLQRLGVTKRWVVLTRQYVLEHLNVSSSAVFLKHFDEITHKMEKTSWGWVGFIVLIYTSISLIGKFGRGLDSVMNEPSELRGDWIHLIKVWLRRACGLVSLPLALTVSVGISHWFKQKNFGSALSLPLSWTTTMVSVFFVYYFIPSRRVGIRRAFRLALVIGPVLEILRQLLGWYAESAFSGQQIYGVFAVIPILILWIQLSWAVLLSGAIWLRVRPIK